MGHSIASRIARSELIRRVGRVQQFNGLVVESAGPDVFVGEVCEIYPPGQDMPVVAEVVGFRDQHALLVPFGNMHGLHIGSEVIATGRFQSVPVGDVLIGRVVDAFCRPLDGLGPIAAEHFAPLYPPPINPLERCSSSDVVETGVKVIDLFLPIMRGQRMGIFAGSGVGKSTILGMIARNVQADMFVIAMVGERGREVSEFIVESLGEAGLARSVVVAAAADESPLIRTHAAYTATAIAEHFCREGKHVVLAMDSVTRFAMAQREVGLAVGEPPTARGYTPSAFSAIPKIVERAGSFKNGGAITAFYTVLVEGDDFNEPISDALRAILDGHIMMTREMANQGIRPSVDVLQSVSRMGYGAYGEEAVAAIASARALLSEYQQARDLLDMGAYRPGQNPTLDQSLWFVPRLRELLRQGLSDRVRRSTVWVEFEAMLAESRRVQS